MKKRSALLPIAATAAALLLTACGTTEAPKGDADAAALVITDDRGIDVELAGPAENVVALEWNTVEALISLGVQPVGVADVEGFTTWVKAVELDDSATDVGQRGEPSIDAIAGLAPDLVVSTSDLPEAAIAQIEEFAPVLIVRGANAEDPIGQMESNLNKLATATGTEDKAAELLTAFDDRLALGTEEIADAGLAGERFFMSDSWVTGGQVSIRPFTSGALLSAVTEKLGLVNAWSGEGDPDYGLGSTDVEGLTAVGPAQFLYIATVDMDPYANELVGNAVWESLPAVQNGTVHRLPDGVWMFGSTASMIDYIDAVVATLAP